MDRLRGGAFKDRNEPALFEVALPADPQKTLAAVALRPGPAAFARPGQTTFNLFAVTGVQVGSR
jgi:hypothetical protein